MASSLQNVSRLVPVIAHAVAVFGDEQKATHWLSTPLPFFENRAPQEMLAMDEGLALVEETLTRIDTTFRPNLCSGSFESAGQFMRV